ncbi:hypothetical protein [Acinetobacter bereziniae]|uniref:hypothetical protein n=1 Tax=Acinetobacter bereziniae TaxID=106648 RepID=UPI0012503B45|nr:hypothetical protein [Acinetobacter bereziniae]
MLKPINNVASRIADGRRFASRSIVMTKFSSIECFVFRRTVIPAESGETREETIWEGGQILSDSDEHATEYIEQGYAMLLFDHFTGGSLHSDANDINIGEAMLYAQIEPFYLDNYPNKSEMVKHVPEWVPKKGDVFGLVIREDLIKWLECIGVTGQSIHSDYGDRYILSVRDSLMHLEPFKNHQNIMLPEVNNFPTSLDKLLYSDTPIYDIFDQGTTDMSDDVIKTKVFKLVTFTDAQFSESLSIIPIKYMAKKTNSPYFFNAKDQANINVDIGTGEQFILSTKNPVTAIETSLGYFSNLLLVTDHIAVVEKIRSDLLSNKSVVMFLDGKPAFEVLPANYDEIRKAYLFVLFVQMNIISKYVLQFEDGTKYDLIINSEAVEVA